MAAGMAVGAGASIDHDAIGRLYDDHRLALVRLAVLLVDDVGTAEDVVQDAFAHLVRRGEHLRNPDAASAYLRDAVVNGCRSALRRRRVARGYTRPRPVEADGPDARLLLAEEHREVLAALGTLPRRQREVLVLRYWSGLSEAEIAGALGISRGAVKSTASRALDALEVRLGGTR
jgi:RNA polymerase sigma-70 factor (sigma-E family)